MRGGSLCCLLPRWCSGRRAICLGRAALCARGRRPARSPSAPRAYGSARRLEARPGPATAHGHRSQALRSLRRPPHQWGLLCWRVAGRVVSRPALALPPPTSTAARPRHRRPAPQPGPPVPPAPSAPVGPVVLSTIRLVSRPVLALPPPTGTAARPFGPSGTHRTGSDGGLAALEAGCRRVVGVSRF